jgi:TP901 family phage tail tape measure protein
MFTDADFQAIIKIKMDMDEADKALAGAAEAVKASFDNMEKAAREYTRRMEKLAQDRLTVGEMEEKADVEDMNNRVKRRLDEAAGAENAAKKEAKIERDLAKEKGEILLAQEKANAEDMRNRVARREDEAKGAENAAKKEAKLENDLAKERGEILLAEQKVKDEELKNRVARRGDELKGREKAEEAALKHSLATAEVERKEHAAIQKSMALDHKAMLDKKHADDVAYSKETLALIDNQARLQEALEKKAAQAHAAVLAADRKQASTVSGASALRVGAGVASFTGNYGAAGGLYALANVAQNAGTMISTGMALGVGGAAALALAIGKTTIEGEKLNVALADMSTLITDVKFGSEQWAETMDRVSDSAIQISNTFGYDVVDVVKMFKEALSSGVDADELQQFGTVAGNMATALGVSLNAASHTLTSFKDNYHLTVNELAEVNNTLFNTINVGGVNVDTLLKNIGRVLPVAKQAGVGIEDLMTAISGLSRTMSTAQSVTALVNVINTLSNPSKKAKVELDRLGISYGDAAFRTQTFIQKMEELRDKTGGTTAALAEIFPNQFGLRGAAALTSMIELLKANNTEIKNTEAALAAVEKQHDTLTFKLSRDWNIVANAFTTAGAALADKVVKPMYTFMTKYAIFSGTVLGATISAVAKSGRASEEHEKYRKELQDYIKMRDKVSENAAKHGGMTLGDETAIENITQLIMRYREMDFFEQEIAKHAEDARKKIADIPTGFFLEYDPEQKNEESKASAKAKEREVMRRATDEQKATLKEMQDEIAIATDGIDQLRARLVNSKALEIDQLRKAVEAARIEYQNLEKDEKATDLEKTAAAKKLEGLIMLYEASKKMKMKQVEDEVELAGKQLQIQKDALTRYDDTILKQKTNVERIAAEKRIKLEEQTAQRLYDIALDYDKKMLGFSKKKDDLDDKYHNKLDAINEKSEMRDSELNQANNDNANDSGGGNLRFLRRQAEDLKSQMASAAAAGKDALYDKLVQQAHGLYDKMKSAAIAGGDTPGRWAAGRGMSFENVFGSFIRDNNKTINKIAEDGATSDYQKDLNELEKAKALAEATWRSDTQKELLKLNEGTASQTTIISSVGARLTAELGTTADKIVAAVRNIRLVAGGSSTPTAVTPGATPVDKTIPIPIPGIDGMPPVDPTVPVPIPGIDFNDNIGADWNQPFMKSSDWSLPSSIPVTNRSSNPSMQSGGPGSLNIVVNANGKDDGAALTQKIRTVVNDHYEDRNVVRQVNKTDKIPTRSYATGSSANTQPTRKAF